MAEAQNILTELRGAVGIITIARPERFNSLDVKTAQDLRRAGLQMARDATVRAVILAGQPGVFCSGADLKYVREHGEPDDLGYLKPEEAASAASYGEAFKQILEYIHSTISEIRRAPKPFIAAVDGIAAAGGFGLAMACDLVVASERASFEWAYGKTGLTGAESSTFFLPRLIGMRKALELVFLNPRLTAEEAIRLGLINRVFPVESLDAEARKLAEQLAAGPVRAWSVAKSLLNLADGGDRLDVHLDQELESLTRIAEGDEFAEGLDGFLGKRPPRFPGK